jgi:hypothetical protein
MASTNITPTINYLNKNFADFQAQLQNFAQTYFPTTYNDFQDADPGAMFMGMASYIGDVLSFYIDTQIQETFPLLAKQAGNLINQAYVFGYRPKTTYASTTDTIIYQIVPSIISGSITKPNMTYALIIPENTQLQSTSTSTTFLTMDAVDFSETTGSNISYINDNFFLLQQTVTILSAQIKTTTFTFGDPQKFQIVTINDSNIIKILDVVDTNSNLWTEVAYLAQGAVFQPLTNNLQNNPYYINGDPIPYILSLQQVPNRFTSRFNDDGTLNIEFGAGVISGSDSMIIPNPDIIGQDIISGISYIDQLYNKANFLYTKEYGVSPTNTTLTVRYLVGGGISSNVPSNDITIINPTGSYFKVTPTDAGGSTTNTAMQNDVLANITTTNPNPATGGRDGDSAEELRLNTIYANSTQLRAVTKQDYILRALSMPADYGAISKAYIVQDLISNDTSVANPLALSLYILSYNSNKNLIQASNSLKYNLSTYLNQYRIATDGISIKDAFYINFGINFGITTVSGYNNRDVLSNCILAIQTYFSIDQWQINQPILISDIQYLLLQQKGVQSVVNIDFINKQGGTYSPYAYDMVAATQNNVIYPSQDPMIFELRFPLSDIQGRVLSF